MFNETQMNAINERLFGEGVASTLDLIKLHAIIDTIGDVYYVDGTDGSDAHVGTSWGTAFKTIAAAVAACAAGDTIYIKGSFSEAVTCSKAGVRFIASALALKRPRGRW